MALIPIEAASPGDLVFERGTAFLDTAIIAAQRIRWRHCDWSHVAILRKQDAEGQWSVIQAEARGVEVAPFDCAPGTYAVVSLPSGCNRAKVLAAANSSLGRPYGFLSILSIFFDLFTPAFLRLTFGQDGALICSALAALSLHAGGASQTFAIRDLYNTTPDQLYMLLNP